VASEEDALNLLFLGDTNRMIAETPMNMASSRSHCVFSLHLEARRAGEAVVRRSKLNLVDLAGSERAAKSGIDGTTLSEAKYINASLHFLEQVIMALQVCISSIEYVAPAQMVAFQNMLGLLSYAHCNVFCLPTTL
jgi:kinesin family member 6/9